MFPDEGAPARFSTALAVLIWQLNARKIECLPVWLGKKISKNEVRDVARRRFIPEVENWFAASSWIGHLGDEDWDRVSFLGDDLIHQL
jgi:hypothetical protein